MGTQGIAWTYFDGDVDYIHAYTSFEPSGNDYLDGGAGNDTIYAGGDTFAWYSISYPWSPNYYCRAGAALRSSSRAPASR